MNQNIKNWLHQVDQQQSLGHCVDETEWPNDEGSTKQYWDHLWQWKFISDELWSQANEIQGHHPSFLDIQTLSSKQILDPSLCSLEWKILLHELCLRHNIAWNHTSPFVSFAINLRGRQCRISLQHHSLSPNSLAKFFLRFHSDLTLPITSFLQPETFYLQTILERMINVERCNTLICGSTGSGKTTLMKSLASCIDDEEHIVTLEDTAELHLPHQRITSFIAQADGGNTTHSLESLCAYAMRITPDRLLLGEIRGSEIIALSLLLNTGHSGLLTTVHATSAIDALHRLALLFCLHQREGQQFEYNNVLKFLSKQFQRVIFVKKKKIQSIISIIGADDGNVFYETIHDVSNCPVKD